MNPFTVKVTVGFKCLFEPEKPYLTQYVTAFKGRIKMKGIRPQPHILDAMYMKNSK